MNMLPYLPSVLQIPNGRSISVERALKQIKELMVDYMPATEDCEASLNDKINASFEDLEAMLERIC